ncbi:MAG TPA: SufE family protein [Acidobacteriota bacterium]|nr:SufE family protein [Acidobacteriota bacterium]
MSPIPEKLQETIDNLAIFPDRSARIELLMATADSFNPVPEEVARRPFEEERRVKGCESEAFVFPVPRPDGRLDFYFAVENPQGISAMAMARILQESCSGAPLEEVIAVPQDVVYKIFGEELSMGKNMGLTNMVFMVQNEARKRRRRLEAQGAQEG